MHASASKSASKSNACGHTWGQVPLVRNRSRNQDAHRAGENTIMTVSALLADVVVSCLLLFVVNVVLVDFAVCCCCYFVCHCVSSLLLQLVVAVIVDVIILPMSLSLLLFKSYLLCGERQRQDCQ